MDKLIAKYCSESLIEMSLREGDRDVLFKTPFKQLTALSLISVTFNCENNNAKNLAEIFPSLKRLTFELHSLPILLQCFAENDIWNI